MSSLACFGDIFLQKLHKIIENKMKFLLSFGEIG